MKNLLVILTLILQTEIFAIQYFCQGNRGNVSMGVLLETINGEERYVLNYFNADGRAGFPFYEGVVTEETLPFLKEAQNELKDFEHHFKVSWAKSDCRLDTSKHFLIDCGGKATYHFPENTKLISYTLSTSVSTEEKLGQTFFVNKFRLGVEGEFYHHSLLFPFNPEFCLTKK
jgi:hypothetical protein